MEKTSHIPLPATLHDLAAMAMLLERLERQPRKASAEQYRDVVQRVGELLVDAEPGDALNALLAVAPATAEIYENQQYAHAGLVRSPLDASLAAENAAVAAIARARRTAPAA
jgi:nitroreductase